MLKIFNTTTKVKENFSFPLKKVINIYVCGVTTYDLCHIGHARTFLIFDVIIRYLQNMGYTTYYVRNITDIDDKIINRAKKNNELINKFTSRMILKMQKDFLSLNFLKPNKEPRVTAHISDIIDMIKQLINNQHAYIAKNGDVLFSINSYKKYGCLSRRILHNVFKEHNNYYKDFVLWKRFIPTIHKKKFVDSIWNSPWGLGRPGWHIECSAIHYKHFLNGIDIHGGGIDLLFPHHENELAQSICFKKKYPIHFWMHTGMVIINNKKMSKSLNNFITIRSLLEKYHYEVIRYYFLCTHYRHPLHYKNDNLIVSYNILKYIYITIKKNVSFICVNKKQYQNKIRNNFIKKFYIAMNNDFNTPKVCSLLYELSQYINNIHNINIELANILTKDLIFFGNILGLLNSKPDNFLNNNKNFNIDRLDDIKKLIKLRSHYRKLKKWELADSIRKKLLKFGIVLTDKKDFSTYKFV